MKKIVAVSFILFSVIMNICKISVCATEVSKTSANKQTLRAGFFFLDGYHEIDDNNRYSGYGYEITERISQLCSWDVDYVGYDKNYPEMIEMLENGEIDFLLNASYTKERSEKFLYSDYDIGCEETIITIREEDKDLFLNKKLFDGIKIAVLKNDPAVEILNDYLSNCGISYSLLEYNSVNEFNNDITNKAEANAFFSSGYRKLQKNEVILKTLSEEYTYIITRKSDTELMHQINEALEKILKYDPDVLSNLKIRNFNVKQTPSIYLSREQREYLNLNKGKVYKAIVLGNNKPFCYKENNVNKGIIPEYISLIENASGLSFEIISVDSIEDYVFYIENGLVDLCLDTNYDFSISEKFDLRLTNPYIDIPLSSVKLKNISFASNKIGVFTTGLSESLFTDVIDNYDDIVIYSNSNNLINDLNNHIIKNALLPSYISDYYLSINKSQLYEIENINNLSYNLCISILDKNDLVLASIISDTVYYVGDKKLQNIVLSEIEKINNGNELILYIKNNPTIIWVIFLASILIVILFAILLYGANNTKRQRRLAEINLSYFKTFLSANKFAIEIVLNENHEKTYIYYRISPDNEIIKIAATENDFTKYASKIHTDDAKEFFDLFSDENINLVLNEHVSIYKEFRAVLDNKKYSYIGITMQAISGSYQDRLLLFIKDIDASKQQEDEKRNTLQMALDTAKEFENSKNNFLSQMSHDIRTPLNAIVGMATLSELNIDDKEKVKGYLDSILDASDHLLCLVNDILDVSRIESGKFYFSQKRIKITSPLNKAIEILTTKADEKEIKLNLSLGKISHLNVLADESRLEQVFINLISNAIKYTLSGGTIDITLCETYLRNDKYYYDFTVSDNGIGMSQNTIDTLFEPFTRGEEAKEYEGTGLGMTITKSIIDAMGGVISVESALGKGTKFIVSLSFSDEERSNYIDISLLKYKKILIASYDDSINSIVKSLFDSDDIDYDIVDSSIEVLRKIKKNTYDIIFINMILSLDDEISLIDNIRDFCGNDVIILCSSYEDKSICEMIMQKSRPDGFISSSISPNDLISIISDAFDSRKLSRNIKIERTIVSERCLIVEDVEINAMFIEGIAKMKGFDTTIVSNGLEACEQLEKMPDDYYSIVFMDIQMPVMNGLDATRRIRSSTREYLKNIPIIAMSANTYPEDILKCKNAGMSEHISKPIDVNRFNEISDLYTTNVI